MEYLDGQQSAIHAFDIKDKTEIHFINELEFNQHQVIGIGKTCSESNLDIQVSDFISILGSLNGELKNSLYVKIKVYWYRFHILTFYLMHFYLLMFYSIIFF